MKIIGAGFCRTGTMSTRQALVDLGFDPCFHMADVHRNRLAYLFIHFLEGNRKPLLEYLAKNPVQAAVDFPMSGVPSKMPAHQISVESKMSSVIVHMTSSV